LIDSVFQLLFRFESPISEKHIAMFHGLTKNSEIEELKELLHSDHRFLACQDNHWQCAPLSQLVPDKNIKEIDFVITDIETTGSIQGNDRIIDLAAIKVRNGVEIDRFESLINPQKKISPTIIRLTGINNESVKFSPVIETVLPKFIDFVGEGIFIAHNTLFDYHFIKAEIRRLKLKEFQSQVEVCTYRLAKKLLPNVKACGVEGLAKYFEYPLENRHRAMPDVLATTFYFEQFVKMLRQQGISTLHQLVNFQKEVITQKKLKKKIKGFLRKKAFISDSRRRNGKIGRK